MIIDVQKRTYTPEEYLALETQSDIRHEYINGEIIPMVGGIPNHNCIVLNIASLLHFSFKKRPYKVFVKDQRLWIPQYRIYTYPDVMVVHGDLILQEGRKDTITNPVLIVEVLSESTASCDQGQKFLFYRSIPSFQEYLLIDQYTISAQHYSKIGDKKWQFQEFNALLEEIQFAHIPCRISIADIYDKVVFDNHENTPQPTSENTPL